MHWVIITGAFPPDQGGLADYTAVLAAALADGGEPVTVLTGPRGSGLPAGPIPGVRLRALSDHFGRAGLAEIDLFLASLKTPCQILVQYVPQPFGPRTSSRFKGLPLTFARWVRRRKLPIWTMFHEATVLTPPGTPLSARVLALVADQMLAWMVQGSARNFVAMSAWEPHLARHLAPGHRIEYLPIPSNVATSVDPPSRDRTRASLLNGHARAVIGHFGTFSSEVTHLMEPLIRSSLANHPERHILLVGDGSRDFARQLGPSAASLVTATGRLSSAEVAQHLAACDLMLQPFPDGASTRRGSIMAGLALGVPVVSNLGSASEALWQQHDALALGPEPAALNGVVDRLLANPVASQALGARGRSLYETQFSLAHTLHVLRA